MDWSHNNTSYFFTREWSNRAAKGNVLIIISFEDNPTNSEKQNNNDSRNWSFCSRVRNRMDVPRLADQNVGRRFSGVCL